MVQDRSIATAELYLLDSVGKIWLRESKSFGLDAHGGITKIIRLRDQGNEAHLSLTHRGPNR